MAVLLRLLSAGGGAAQLPPPLAVELKLLHVTPPPSIPSISPLLLLQEFLRGPDFALIPFCIGTYLCHPLMQQAAYFLGW